MTMKITPLEIRQKSFEKKLRGYDKDEVNAFLLSLSNEWERALDENKELKIKLDQATKEVDKLREVESSLFKTLKTAEDTGANLVDQANKTAELHMKETQMAAEALMNESKSKARSIIEKAEMEAKQIIVEMQDAVKDLEQNYRIIENNRENLITELKNLSTDIVERIDRTNKQKSNFKLVDHLHKVKELVRESHERVDSEGGEPRNPRKSEPKKVVQKTSPEKATNPYLKQKLENKSQTTKKNDDNVSFFDELE